MQTSDASRGDNFWRLGNNKESQGIPKKKTGRSRSTAHPAKTRSKIRDANRASVLKSRPKPKHERQTSSGDKTIMTVNGRAIKQDNAGKMYVMKNDRKTYL
jgi:hypothetical protein